MNQTIVMALLMVNCHHNPSAFDYVHTVSGLSSESSSSSWCRFF